MLINLRNALMTGRRLPYDAEVEYLESTGTQYIDTGVVWNRALTVSATVVGLQSTTFPLQTFFGARNLNAANAGYTFGFNSSNRFVSDNSGSRAISSMNYAQGAVYTIVKNLSGCSITNAAGTTENLINNAGTQTATYNLLLFALNNVGNPAIAKCRFYGCKIWDANGILVRDLIPVRRGTVGYLYDRVSGKLFGNAGTGDFVLGQDVVPVEYIESHGTEYIDTGVLGNPPTTSDVSFRWIGNQTADSVLVGSRNYGITAQRYMLLMTNRNMNQQYGAGGSWAYGRSGSTGLKYTADTDYNVRTVFESGASSAFVNGVQNMTSTNTLADTGVTIYLFATHVLSAGDVYSVANYAKARMYNCKLYAGNTLVRDYKPVRVGTDATSWEGAMMDTLTRRIYRNAGTGAFTYGNDLKYPIPAE